jgi:hypothetical protein
MTIEKRLRVVITMRCFTRFDTLARPAEAFPRSHVAHSTWIPDGLTVQV